MNFLNAFAGAMVRQIGRDSGRVVSNSLFGDRHASVYRRAGSQAQAQVPQRRMPSVRTILGPVKTAVKDETNLNYAHNYLESFYSQVREFNEDGIIDEEEMGVLLSAAIELKHRLVSLKGLMQDQKSIGAVNQAMAGLDEFVDTMEDCISKSAPQPQTNFWGNVKNQQQINAYDAIRARIDRYKSSARY